MRASTTAASAVPASRANTAGTAGLPVTTFRIPGILVLGTRIIRLGSLNATPEAGAALMGIAGAAQDLGGRVLVEVGNGWS